MRRLLHGVMAVLFALTSATALAQAANPGPSHLQPSLFNDLSWRSIGPFRGGRALAVTGVPGQPDHFYFGAVDGGVWESLNDGRTWTPIFDREPVASIGAIAVAPSAPSTIYVGTGEADMRSNIAYGDGMYRSTDGGKTWAHIGLTDTRQIGAIVVDPHDANVVYVAALGHAYGPNAERGVFKTTDGGATWSKVLYKDDNTGAIDLAMDPSNSSILYASLWQTRRPPWNVYPPSNGPGSGLYKSTDAGKTWTHLTDGLPAHVGHIGVAVSPADPQRVYAQVDSDIEHGGVYRSDDGGAHWKHMAGGASQVRIWKRGWYFGGITADPKNPDTVYVMDTSTYRSTDGGKTFVAIKGAPGGDDYHTLWIEPNDPSRMILGSDQGVIVSVDDATTWSSWYNQNTAQFYHVITDNAFPYHVYGAQQDSGSAMTPSSSKYATLSQQDFHPIDSGGENGYIAPDPRHPGTIFGGSDTVTAENVATGWEQNIDPTTAYPGHIWRHTWTLPLVVSPADPTALYTARQKIFLSHDGGHHWRIISPDLTRSDENHPANLDPATIADSSGLPKRGVVYALAPSPRDANLIWAGTDDGYVWVTHDGGKHWSNVTPKALTPWSKVGIIDASARDPRTAYIAVDRHRLDDYAPYIYRTHDGGAHWTAIVNGIPYGSFVNVVRADPDRAGLLYAGTEKGVEVSFDDGDHWQSLQRNLPVTSVRDIDIHGNDAILATHGRGFYIMDDITPLRALSARIAAARAYLFAPATAIRVRPGNQEGTPLPLDEPQADNRVPGVYIDYTLAHAATTPVVIDILDGTGKVLRSWSSAVPPHVVNPNTVDIPAYWLKTPPVPGTGAGAHRFIWNFAVDTRHGPYAPPGAYKVRLAVDGMQLEQPFAIVRDPRITASDADLRAQYALAMEISQREGQVTVANERAIALAKRPALSASQKRILQAQIIGIAPAADPDDSVGKPSHDFTSFMYLSQAFGGLQDQVESADAAPTRDMRTAFAKLDATLAATLAKLAAMERPR